MQIVSLVPEATEILQALGLGGRTTTLPFDTVRAPERLAAVLQAARPALIFTSESAPGGGVPRAAVRRVVAGLRPRPAVYALEPHTLGDILSDIKTVGDATGRQHQARALIEALRARIDAVTLRSARALAEHPPRRVACLIQSEPPTAAGWWLAELIGLAGGLDVLGGHGRPPRTVSRVDVQAARPELVLRVEYAARGCPLPQPLAHPGRAWERGAWADDAPSFAHGPGGRAGWGEGAASGSLYPRPGPGAVTLLEQLADILLQPEPGATAGVRQSPECADVFTLWPQQA